MAGPKSREDLEREDKAQVDFLSDAAELDDTLDFDDPKFARDEDNEDSNGASDDDASSAKITDAEVDAAGGQKPEEKDITAAAPTPEPVVPPTQEAQTPPTTEAAPPATPDTPTAPAQPPEVQAPAEPSSQPGGQASPEEITQVYKEWRGQTENLLAEHHYVLDRETTEELEVEPAKVIPRLMARVYMDAVTAAIGQITQHMPALVRAVNERQTVVDESENKFFQRWPDLKKHTPTVLRLGQTYRNANPAATEEQFINEVGAQAMVSLRLNPSFIPPQTPPHQQAAPFVPSGQTAPNGAGQRQPSNNMFEQLNNDFDSIEEEIDGR